MENNTEKKLDTILENLDTITVLQTDAIGRGGLDNKKLLGLVIVASLAAAFSLLSPLIITIIESDPTFLYLYIFVTLFALFTIVYIMMDMVSDTLIRETHVPFSYKYFVGVVVMILIFIALMYRFVA